MMEDCQVTDIIELPKDFQARVEFSLNGVRIIGSVFGFKKQKNGMYQPDVEVFFEDWVSSSIYRACLDMPAIDFAGVYDTLRQEVHTAISRLQPSGPTAVTIKVKEALIIMGGGHPDTIHLTLDGPTPFPAMGYVPSVMILAASGYGATWCKEVLGIVPEVRTK